MSQKLPNIGKYEYRRFLGAGNFASVYEVLDVALQQSRALKVIKCQNPNKVIRELTEARLLDLCKHEHVVEVKEADIYSINGQNCVVICTELLDKGSAQMMLQTKYVSLGEAKSIVCDSLFGLEHLHNNGVVHCDIKPGNILLTERMRAKLSDFGLAISVRHCQSPGKVYTLHMAPESCKGMNGTVLTDVYAMGVTLYRLVNNIADFKGIAPSNPRRAIQQGKFPNRNQYAAYVPWKIKRIINKAMNVEPAKRYQSSSKFRQALEKISIAIDWKKISSTEWVAEAGNDAYQILSIPKRSGWSVEFRRNNRRNNKYCQANLKDNWVAESYMSKLVAETSLA